MNLDRLKNFIINQIGQFITIDRFDDLFIIRYKGTVTTDAAAFYCPYVPLQVTSVGSITSVAPVNTNHIGVLNSKIKVYTPIKFKTRYDLEEN